MMTGILRQTRYTVRWLIARTGVIRSERGATAVEYGLMVALIAAVIIAAVVTLGNNTSDTFDCTADSLAARADNCAPAGE